MVPTFTCGLVRLNFSLAIELSPDGFELRVGRCCVRWSPPSGSNRRPRPYQGRALPTELGGRNCWKPGAGDRVRTGDVQLGRLTLYQLSYARRRRARPAGSPTAPELQLLTEYARTEQT